MAAIKRSQFKINNGTDWDTYHFETDSAQTKHRKSDGTETTVEEVLNSALMPDKRTIRAIGMGYDGAIYVCFPLPAVYDKTPTVTNMRGGVTGFATADECKVVLDTVRTDEQTLCFKITSTKGAAVTANRPYICTVSFTIS